MVLHAGCAVPCGVAVRRVMRARGWINVEVEAAGTEYRITSRGETVTLPIVPPRCRTASVRGNARREAREGI
jgi:hypothetical protein